MTTLELWMRAEGLNDAQLARAVGKERSTITKIRLGQAGPSLGLALAIQRISRGKVKPTDYNRYKADEAAE